VEKKLFHDKLTLLPMTLVFATDDWGDLKNHYGIGYGPEIRYTPFDAVELELGAFVASGKRDGLIASMEDFDSLFFRAKVSF